MSGSQTFSRWKHPIRIEPAIETTRFIFSTNDKDHLHDPGMAGYRRTNELTSEIAAYVAGIIDGEGAVTLTRRHRNENRQLVVSISSTEKHLLEFILEKTGVGKITTKRRSSKRHAPGFAWSVSNRQALDLLRQVTPFLQTYKADRARLILKSYLQVTPRNGYYSPALAAERKAFCSAVLDIKANQTTNA